jgi:predicted Rossmann fold flavoprotein
VDVLVIGGGAAGLICAIEAARRGRKATVVERNAQIGRKILISGGGRCNFTNLDTRPEHFLSRNPHFAKSALARFGPRDFVRMVERHGIRYHEKKLGQLFCDGPASQIVDMLERECAAAGARIIPSCTVSRVAKNEACAGAIEGVFNVETNWGTYTPRSLVIATGGLSIPKIGATPFGYTIARQFGLGIAEPRPALVPLLFGPADLAKFAGLAGVSTEVLASAGGFSFREKMLFTHRFREKMLFTHQGLSGPAILQASSYWTPGASLEIDLLPDVDLVAALREGRAQGERAEVRTVLARFLPKRLADRWCEAPGAAIIEKSKPVAMLSDREMDAASTALHAWRVAPAGDAGYDKAEVTAGGVDTAELSSKTFEARKAAGLYFIGEVVDVTGHLGGFNFQWAWASGYSAGQYV